jgi:acyl-homoserine lactone acylase PvdQ
MSGYRGEDFLMNFLDSILQNSTRFTSQCSSFDNINCKDVIYQSFSTAVKNFTAFAQKKWGDIHHLVYPHNPLSSNNLLKMIFHRTVPAAGSRNTVNVAGPVLRDFPTTKRLDAKHSANLKLITDGEKILISLDTGISGNIFSGHYFDMNARHIKGNLYEMILDESKLRKKKIDVLTFNYGLKDDL